jgi:MtrB/PioB family decaheme-associated outer membrane protein
MKTNLLLFGSLMICICVSQRSWSQTQTSDTQTETSIDATAAVWGNHFEEESSKAEEYGEIPEGFLINSFKADVRLKSDRFIELGGKNVGLNDARYTFNYGITGKYRLHLDYTKIPHLFSRNGETIWTETAPGQWRLSDAVQNAIESLNPVPPNTLDPAYLAGITNQRQFVSDLLNEAHHQDLKLQRNRTTAEIQYSPNATWNYGVQYFLENRDGFRPFGTSLGFSWATELPEHIDYATQRFHAGAEYNRNGKNLQIAYDLSLFNNDINAMIWDNPLRLHDRTYSSAYVNGDGTSQGRVQLAPDNTSNTFSVAAAANVGRGRLTGSVAYSLWSDEVDLLPFTINTAIEPIPLPGNGTFHGDQKNLNLNLRYHAPVATKGDFTASYRLYDVQNDNDRFNIPENVRLDQVLEERTDPLTSLFAFRTNTLDTDFAWRLTNALRWHAGYRFDRWNRDERETNETNTNQFKTSLDALTSDWLTLRFSYAYSQRRSDEFDIEGDVYQFLPLRRFDTANLNQNLVRAMADFIPSESTTLGITATLTNNDYPDSDYGVSKWNFYSIGADFSYAFKHTGTIDFFYEHANSSRDQRGRQSNPDGTPAIGTDRDWTVTLDNQYETLGAGYSRPFYKGKANWDIHATYAFADGNADIGAGPALRPTGAVDLLQVDDTDLITIQTGFNYKILQRVRIGAFYWFEKYLIDDFAEDSIQTDLIFIPIPGQPVPAVSGAITLNAIQPDYEFHSGWIGLIYSW